MNYQEFQALLEARTRWLQGKSRALRGELRAMLMDYNTFVATHGPRPTGIFAMLSVRDNRKWAELFDHPWAARVAPKARDAIAALARLRELHALQEIGLTGTVANRAVFNTWIERSNGAIAEASSLLNQWFNDRVSNYDTINVSARARAARFWLAYIPAGQMATGATGTTPHQAVEAAGGLLETLTESASTTAASAKEHILGPLGPQATTTPGNGGGLPTWIVPIAVGTLVIGAGALIYLNWTTGGAVARTGEYAAGRDDRYRGR
jgi:hypothetical protein